MASSIATAGTRHRPAASAAHWTPRPMRMSTSGTMKSSTRPRIGCRSSSCVPKGYIFVADTSAARGIGSGTPRTRDASGTLRFVSVVLRDVSDVDAFVECQVPASIPLYRLVHFQVERPARDGQELPAALREGKVLSAIYRVGPYKTSTGTPSGYALRLLVERAQTAVRRERHPLAVAN